jgi:LPS-assembly protein
MWRNEYSFTNASAHANDAMPQLNTTASVRGAHSCANLLRNAVRYALGSIRPSTFLTGCLVTTLANISLLDAAWGAECESKRCPPSAMEQVTRSMCATTPTLESRKGLDPAASISFSAEDLSLDGEQNMHLTNGVELRQGERVLRAPEMHYDASKDQWEVSGNVELSDPSLIVRGAGAQASTATGTVSFEATEFELPARFGHGSANKIQLSRDGEVHLDDVKYTTCEGPKPDWEINASQIHIDSEAHSGSARNAWVTIKGVPVFYTPYLSFPVGSEPKTGLLFPGIGNSQQSGRQISVPWYWSIAPNYDATITPTWYSKRGVDLGTEFRFLRPAFRGVVQANYLVDDQGTGRFEGHDRHFVELHAQTDFAPRLRLYTDGSNVSDNEWLEDFGTGGQRTGVAVLPRAARLIYRGDDWSLAALVQNHQTVDPEIDPSLQPYSLMPQLSFRGWYPDSLYGLTFGAIGEYSNFRSPDDADLGNGQRLDMAPEVRWPLRSHGFHLEPAVSWRYTAYQLEESTASLPDRSPTRSAPIFSVDSGATFERFSGRSQQRIQTLEPRVLYLYVPYRHQDDLPLFDTRQPDFNLIQLYGLNRYAGADRLGDANHVAMGVTTRLLDAQTGIQYLSATIGEVYRFATPAVRLPGESANVERSSDVIGELKLGEFKNWNGSIGVQLDPNTQRLQRTEVSAQYIPGVARIVNASYVYRRADPNPTPGTSQAGLEQIDVSGAWPIGTRVNVYARYVHSLQEKKMLDGMAGVEYRDCCWGFRFGLRQSRSLDGELETSWQWQIELNGLAGVGTANDAFLSQAIRGYSAARFDRRSVP